MIINRYASLTAAALASICISPALAQGDFDYDATSPATFGKTLNLDYKGAPGAKPMMFMMSLSGGPVPLKLMFGGSDPRSIQVGLDLLPAWLLIATTPSGTGRIPVNMPNIPALAGAHLHLQMMTGGGTGPNIVDKISNKIVVVPGARYSTSTLLAKLGDGRNPQGPGRAMMGVIALPNTDGKIMLAGGGTGNILGAIGLQTTEIFDSRTNSVSPGPDMTSARALATFTTLQNGRVLVVGGVDNNGDPTATCEIYNPATNAFTPTGSMGTRRAGHAAALLNDGRVLVVAGTRELKDIAKAITGLLNSAEIYNPSSGTWSNTGSISKSVVGASLTTLNNGKVLVAGGGEIYRFFGIPTRVQSVTTSQLYNPASGSWSSTGSMRTSRAVHTFNTIRLNSGIVLVTGGYTINIGLLPPPTNFNGAQANAKCEFYNPSTGSWTALPDMSSNRAGHSVTQIPSGTVIIAGGATGALDAPVAIGTIQEYNHGSRSFVRTYNLGTARGTHGAALTSSGSVALFDGLTDKPTPSTLPSIELIHR